MREWPDVRRRAMQMMGFLCSSVVKNLPAKQEMWVRSLGWEDLSSIFLPGKSHGQSLAGYGPWGCKKSDRI